VTRQGTPYLNWDEMPGYIPLGTKVRLLRHGNIEGWIVAYQRVSIIEPTFYYVSVEKPIWDDAISCYTAIRSDMEVIP
jgi:hypothetical protein